MKKILLTAAAVSVFATSSAYAMENSFYIKANAGWLCCMNNWPMTKSSKMLFC